jgi:predicted metal-dependent hydrolase
MKSNEIITFNSLEIKVYYKKIKNINLKINNKHEITISAPRRISKKDLENFLISKQEWILKTLKKVKKVDLNEFYYLGKKYELIYTHSEARFPTVEISKDFFLVYLNKGIPEITRNRLLNKYFEIELLSLTKDFFKKWEEMLGVSKKSLIIKSMKGKWGYCHTRNHDICLNIDLIKKDKKFIEYVVLHELCHIIVPNHGPEFKALLNRFMPNWKKVIKEFST